MENYAKLASWIKQSQNIAFLTGAGISTPSGIPDFRSLKSKKKDGLNIEGYISRSFLNLYPKLFWENYKQIFQLQFLEQAAPNDGHNFIANLERTGKSITVITQNIDGLHQKSGSTNVIELHGSIKTAYCPKCKIDYQLEFIMKQAIPRCNNYIRSERICNLILHPNIVLYGDSVKNLTEAHKTLDNADLFIVIGTSLQVSPVNLLPDYFRLEKLNNRSNQNLKMVLINKEFTQKGDLFPMVYIDDIITVVKKLNCFNL